MASGKQALRFRATMLDQPPTVMINGVDENGEAIVVRVGLFFAVADAGPAATATLRSKPHEEYCVVQTDRRSFNRGNPGRAVDT